MDRNTYKSHSPKATHPGTILRYELEERVLTQKASAELIGMRPYHLSELLNGKRSMTISIADKILGKDSY